VATSATVRKYVSYPNPVIDAISNCSRWWTWSIFFRGASK